MMTFGHQRWAVWGVGLLMGTSALLAQAQSYPHRPIKAIVPYAAGGFSDQASRIIAEAMSRNLGQNIVIENRAGGGGRIGSEAVTKMAPDGYQLLMTTNGTKTYGSTINSATADLAGELFQLPAGAVGLAVSAVSWGPLLLARLRASVTAVLRPAYW